MVLLIRQGVIRCLELHPDPAVDIMILTDSKYAILCELHNQLSLNKEERDSHCLGGTDLSLVLCPSPSVLRPSPMIRTDRRPQPCHQVGN